MAWEYYEFLGVHPSASAEDVKRACFRKRRELAVKDDQKGQEFLSQVSETLLDPQNRERYDALQKHGDRVALLVNNAVQAMEREAWADAVRLLKQAVALMPTDTFVNTLLGICYARSCELAEAVGVFRELARSDPESPDIWSHLGGCLRRLAGTVPDDQGMVICPNCGQRQSPPWALRRTSRKCSGCGSVLLAHKGDRKDSLLLEARESFAKAIQLQSYNSEHYIGMARTYEMEGRYDEAASWVERSIGADGATDFRDTEAFCYLGWLLVLAKQFQRAQSTAARMKEVLAGNEDAIAYAAQRFLHMANQAFEAGAFDASIMWCRMTLTLSPQDCELREAAEACRLVAYANIELSRLTKDPSIEQPVAAAAAYFVAVASGAEPRGGQELLKRICEAIDRLPRSNASRSLDILRNRYPHAYRCGRDFFDKVAQALASSGCLLALLCMAALASFAVGGVAFGVAKLIACLL